MPPDYHAPVSKLLELGQPGLASPWHDYGRLGVRVEDIPELIRMVQDEALNSADSASLEVWAPVHAWRALGQLRSEAAVAPLLDLLRRIDENDDDWVSEDIPPAFGQIGPIAVGPLEAYLADTAHRLFARVAAAASLKEIGQRHPEARAACVRALQRPLDQANETGLADILNGFVVGDLLKLQAVEAASAMERAFARGAVDESIAGDWNDVQVDLGLKPRPLPGLRTFEAAPPLFQDSDPEMTLRAMQAAQKLARPAALPPASRKRNRHRKKKK